LVDEMGIPFLTRLYYSIVFLILFFLFEDYLDKIASAIGVLILGALAFIASLHVLGFIYEFIRSRYRKEPIRWWFLE
jgi:hypothetical protein